MFHNPSVLAYYAEARHTDDLSRLPAPDRLPLRRGQAATGHRFPLARLVARFRVPSADSSSVPFTHHPA